MRASTLRRAALALYRDESGSEIMEYAMITAVLSMTVLAAFMSVSAQANNGYAGTENNVATWGVNPP